MDKIIKDMEMEWFMTGSCRMLRKGEIVTEAQAIYGSVRMCGCPKKDS